MTKTSPPAAVESQFKSKRLRLIHLLWEGQTSPPELLQELGLHPGQLAQMAARRAFRRTVHTVRLLADYRRELSLARVSQSAIESLTTLARGKGETARKAALDLLRLQAGSSLDQRAAQTGTAGHADDPADDAPPGDLERRLDSLLEQLATPLPSGEGARTNE